MSFSIFTKFKAVDGVTPAFKSMIAKGNSFQQQAGRIQNAFARAFRSVGSGLRSLKTGFNSVTDKIFTVKNAIMGIAAGAAINTIASIGKSWLDMASDLTETRGKIDVVFGSMNTNLYEWAKTSTKTMGLAQQTALDSAALFGDMATGMGLSKNRAAEMSMSLTQLGADLASFKNISNDVASTALKSIFTGETESLKNLGVMMLQANLEEFARSKGLRKKIKDMTEAEKVELRYAYVMAKTTNAQGDFLRTGGNAANQMRIFSEMLKEVQTNLGGIMLPVYTRLLKQANQLLIDNGPLIQTSFERVFGILSKIFNKAAQIFTPFKIVLVDEILPELNYWFRYFGTTLAPIFINAFKKNLPTILSIFKNLWEVLRLTIPIVLEVAAVVFKSVFDIGTNILKVFDGILNFINGVFSGNWRQAWNGLTEIVSGLFKGLVAIIKGLLNLLISPLNMIIDGYNAIAVKNGKPEVKRLPMLASGTNYFSGGLALVGERGPEIVQLPAATKVYNNNRTVRMIEQMSQPRKDNVIDFEKYFKRQYEIKPPQNTYNNETIQSVGKSKNPNVNNDGLLTLELIVPDGYDAKVVNAKTPDGREFKVKLRGKRKQ